MKSFISCFYLLLVLSIKLFSQNLVSNPSFENFASCPTEEGQIDIASPWFSSNGGTADLFSSCADNQSEVSVPNNIKGGNQSPLSGESYAGIRVFSGQVHVGTEYLGAELATALEAGKLYQIIFNVALSEDSEFAISSLGMYLSSTKLIQSGGVFDTVNPQITNKNGFITDTDEWTQISSCYQATGNEKFLTIGNFNSDENTTSLRVTTTDSRAIDAYYMIDDVSIVEIDYQPTLGYDSAVCQIDVHTYQVDTEDSLFTLFPNAEVDFPSNGNQILDTILEFPLEITDGNCVFYDTTTFYEQPAIDLDFGLDTNLCEEDTLALISSSEGTNLWSTGEMTDTIYVSQEGTYHVLFTDKLCDIKDSISVHIILNPEIVLPDSVFLCKGDNIILDAYFESSEYTWQDNSQESFYAVTEEGHYHVTIENSCGIDTAESYVMYDLFENMTFPNVITPNNDGRNDNFVVEGADNCKLEFTVVNRWGGQVYYSNDYKNDWPKEKLSTGTYFYSICGEHFDCKQKGWIQVIK